MFALGLALAVCFVPGYTGATIPTQWVLLSAILPLSLWRSAPPSICLWLWGIFLTYAALSTLWSTNIYTSVLGLWYAAIWALSFWLGTSLPSLAQLWKGLAIGLSISSLVAVAQAFGYHPVEAHEGYPGLLYNTTAQGASIALILIALASHRLWWYMPPLAVGLVLSQSRGAALILAATALTRIHWLAAIAALILGALAYSFWLNPADSQRLQIWGYALRGLTFFGWGPDSFNDVYFLWRGALTHAEFVHNDYLQLAFEYGLGALAIFAIFGLALTIPSTEWPILFSVAVLATFFFPLYHPLTAFIAFVATGHASRCRAWNGNLSKHRRSHLLPRYSDSDPITLADWG